MAKLVFAEGADWFYAGGAKGGQGVGGEADEQKQGGDGGVG